MGRAGAEIATAINTPHLSASHARPKGASSATCPKSAAATKSRALCRAHLYPYICFWQKQRAARLAHLVRTASKATANMSAREISMQGSVCTQVDTGNPCSNNVSGQLTGLLTA